MDWKKQRKIVYFLNTADKNTQSLLDQLSPFIQVTKITGGVRAPNITDVNYLGNIVLRKRDRWDRAGSPVSHPRPHAAYPRSYRWHLFTIWSCISNASFVRRSHAISHIPRKNVWILATLYCLSLWNTDWNLKKILHFNVVFMFADFLPANESIFCETIL